MKLHDFYHLPRDYSRAKLNAQLGGAAALVISLLPFSPAHRLIRIYSPFVALCVATWQYQESETAKRLSRRLSVQEGLTEAAGFAHDAKLLSPTSTAMDIPVIEPPKLVNAIEEVKRQGVSVLIFGNSGSGKSSTARLLIGAITAQRDAIVLVADHHLNDWGNLPVIGKLPNVLRTIDCIVKELDRRQNDWERQCRELPKSERKKDYPFFIFVWDEIGGVLTYAKSKEGRELIKKEGLIDPSDALLRLGSELRKFKGLFIGLNQSGTTDALGIDGSYRNNFVDIHLCESALNQIDYCLNWKKDDNRWQFVDSKREGYPCIVKGKPALHPTHAHHQLFAEGNPPIQVNEPNLLPLDLELPETPIVYNADPSCETARTVRAQPAPQPARLEPVEDARDAPLSKEVLLKPEITEKELERAWQLWNNGTQSKEQLCKGVWGGMKRGHGRIWKRASIKIQDICIQLELFPTWLDKDRLG